MEDKIEKIEYTQILNFKKEIELVKSQNIIDIGAWSFKYKFNLK